MKRLFTLAAMIVVSTVLYPQNALIEGAYFENENSVNDEVVFTGTKEHKGLIWVQDSSYFYQWNDMQYNYTSKIIMLNRDEWGNATITRTMVFDTVSQTDVNSQQFVRTYDAAGNMLFESDQDWNVLTESWIIDREKTYEFDANGNETLRRWVYNNSPNNSFQDLYTYDANGNQIHVMRQYWDDANQAWVNNYQYTNTYDANNYKVTQINQSWDVENSLWVDSYSTTFTYDEPTALLTEEYRQAWDTTSSTWVNDLLQTRVLDNNTILMETQDWDINLEEWQYTFGALSVYDVYPGGNLLSGINYNGWDNNTNSWINSTAFEYEYNSNGDITLWRYQNWDSNNEEWFYTFQDIYEYNANHDRTIFHKQQWDRDANVWVNDFINTYNFDENNNQIEYIRDNWDTVLNDWVHAWKRDYYWSQFEVFGTNEILVANHVEVYPNPASDYIRIDTENMLDGTIVNIYSTTGRLVKRDMINSRNEFIISDLQRGVYFITIEDGDNVLKTKIVKN